jgi:type IV pilus assembly protein PilA
MKHRHHVERVIVMALIAWPSGTDMRGIVGKSANIAVHECLLALGCLCGLAWRVSLLSLVLGCIAAISAVAVFVSRPETMTSASVAALAGRIVAALCFFDLWIAWKPPREPGEGDGMKLVRVALVLCFAAGLCFLAWAGAKVRASGEDKAVQGVARQLAAAADQYFLDYKVTTVSAAQLIGPTNYLKSVHVVAGETYPAFFTQGVAITVTGIAGMRTITFAP